MRADKTTSLGASSSTANFFAALKKEKLFWNRTERHPMAYVKTVIFRYIMVYYNRQRIDTSNPGGWPPAIYPERQLSLAVYS